MANPTFPPQLRLNLPPTATSFKRSFEEFGFDLDSPIGDRREASGSGSSSGSSSSSSSASGNNNERNKRPRNSSSSFDADHHGLSFTTNSAESSTSTSTLSTMSDRDSQARIGVSSQSPLYLEPPRIPTPVIQDVEMPDYIDRREFGGDELLAQADEPAEEEQEEIQIRLPTRTPEYRLSLSFENETESTLGVTRTLSPPPVLPPLALPSLSDQDSQETEAESPFSEVQDGEVLSLPEPSFRRYDDFGAEMSMLIEASSNTENYGPNHSTHRHSRSSANDFQQFRHRLDVIRPSSPLLPEIDELPVRQAALSSIPDPPANLSPVLPLDRIAGQLRRESWSRGITSPDISDAAFPTGASVSPPGADIGDEMVMRRRLRLGANWPPLRSRPPEATGVDSPTPVAYLERASRLRQGAREPLQPSTHQRRSSLPSSTSERFDYPPSREHPQRGLRTLNLTLSSWLDHRQESTEQSELHALGLMSGSGDSLYRPQILTGSSGLPPFEPLAILDPFVQDRQSPSPSSADASHYNDRSSSSALQAIQRAREQLQRQQEHLVALQRIERERDAARIAARERERSRVRDIRAPNWTLDFQGLPTYARTTGSTSRSRSRLGTTNSLVSEIEAERNSMYDRARILGFLPTSDEDIPGLSVSTDLPPSLPHPLTSSSHDSPSTSESFGHWVQTGTLSPDLLEFARILPEDERLSRHALNTPPSEPMRRGHMRMYEHAMPSHLQAPLRYMPVAERDDASSRIQGALTFDERSGANTAPTGSRSRIEARDSLDAPSLTDMLVDDFMTGRHLERPRQSRRGSTGRQAQAAEPPSLPDLQLGSDVLITPFQNAAIPAEHFDRASSNALQSRLPDRWQTLLDSTPSESTSVDWPPHPRRHPVNGRVTSTATPAATLPVTGFLDTDSYAPGPFRSTIRRMRQAQTQETQQQSNPPYIPPFVFDQDEGNRRVEDLSPLNRSDAERFLPPIGQDTHGRNSFRGRDRSDEHTPNMNAQRETSDDTMREWSSHADLHNFLRRQVREDASRLESRSARPISMSSQPAARAPFRGTGRLENLNDALEVLRHDGLSELRHQQLIERYRRQSAISPNDHTTEADLWGEDRALPRARRWSRTSGADDNRRRVDAHEPWSNVFTSTGLTTAASRPERRSRLSSLRAHALDLANAGDSGLRARRHSFRFGDYMRDDDFDSLASYETLTSLQHLIGDGRPKGVPQHIIAGMESSMYKDVATADSDKRCPICLDDYKPLDFVLKLPHCTHWLHKDCLEQWLKNANTCPVCRKDVAPPSTIRGTTHSPFFSHGLVPRRPLDIPDMTPSPVSSQYHRFTPVTDPATPDSSRSIRPRLSHIIPLTREQPLPPRQTASLIAPRASDSQSNSRFGRRTLPDPRLPPRDPFA